MHSSTTEPRSPLWRCGPRRGGAVTLLLTIFKHLDFWVNVAELTRDSILKARSSVGRATRRVTRCVSRGGAPRRLVLCAPAAGCKKCRQTPISTLTSFTPLFPTRRTRRPGAVLRARGSVWTARVPRSVARRRRPGPAAKSVGRPLSLLLQVLPHFSPLSALGAQGPC